MKKLLNNNKGQGILESAIVITLIFVFLGGVINIWIWANNQIVKRQVSYNQTRVKAGTGEDNYTLVWPVYSPDKLTEDKVLVR